MLSPFNNNNNKKKENNEHYTRGYRLIGILPLATRDMLYIRDNCDIPLNTLY